MTATTETTAPIALTITDAVRASGIGRTTLYRLLADGRLTDVRIGKRRLILRSELEALLVGGGVQ